MARVLDLDHLRAHVAEQHRAERAGENAGEVDDLEAAQRQIGRLLCHLHSVSAMRRASALLSAFASQQTALRRAGDLAVGILAQQETVAHERVRRARHRADVAFLRAVALLHRAAGVTRLLAFGARRRKWHVTARESAICPVKNPDAVTFHPR